MATLITAPLHATPTHTQHLHNPPAGHTSRLEGRRDELGFLTLEHRRTVARLMQQAIAYGLDLAAYRPLRQAVAAAERCRDLTDLVEWEQHYPPSC